jgi:multidrug efflux pump subunit AcrA (membrane-fusion protein)
MKKLILLIVVVAIIAAGWFLYFNDGDTASSVNLSEAKYMDLGNSLEFSGKVVPAEMYSVMSESGGTIKDIYVTEGSKVDIGDPLFGLDTTQVENMLEEAQLNYNILKESDGQTVMSQGTGSSLAEEKIKIALALSQTTGYDYESFNSAFAGEAEDAATQMTSSLNGTTLEDVMETETVSDSGLALAKLNVENLEAALDAMSYTSMIDGTVLSVNVRRGEVLAPGVPAMVVADTGNTLIEGYVYEKDVDGLTKGQTVKIYTEQGYYLGTLASIGKATAGAGNTSETNTMIKVQISPGSGFSKMPGAVVDLEILEFRRHFRIRRRVHELAVFLDPARNLRILTLEDVEVLEVSPVNKGDEPVQRDGLVRPHKAPQRHGGQAAVQDHRRREHDVRDGKGVAGAVIRLEDVIHDVLRDELAV